MQRVTGIGGVFFKARDAEAAREWYRKHLGIDVQDWGGAAFSWANDGGREGVTVWTIMPSSSTYLDPSSAPFMVNYRVADLDALLEVLRSEGCNVDEKTDSSEFGKFGWVMDPEGNRIELSGAAGCQTRRMTLALAPAADRLTRRASSASN